MSIATAFAALKEHAHKMMADLVNEVQIGKTHLEDLLSKVEDVGQHVEQKVRTLIHVDVGDMSPSDVYSLMERIKTEFQGSVLSVESVVQEAETVAKTVEGVASTVVSSGSIQNEVAGAVASVTESLGITHN